MHIQGHDILGAHATYGVESKHQLHQDPFLPDLEAHRLATPRKDGEQSSVAPDLPPTAPQTARLPEPAQGSPTLSTARSASSTHWLWGKLLPKTHTEAQTQGHMTTEDRAFADTEVTWHLL
jgi:hypothetical protein